MDFLEDYGYYLLTLSDIYSLVKFIINMEDLLITGNLHIYDILLTDFNPKGIEVHVEGDVFFHQKEDDFIYPSSDKFIDNIFDKYNIKDIIAYSAKFKENQ